MYATDATKSTDRHAGMPQALLLGFSHPAKIPGKRLIVIERLQEIPCRMMGPFRKSSRRTATDE